MESYDKNSRGGNPAPGMPKAQTNLTHLKPGSCNDKSGVSGGVSDLQAISPLGQSPDESSDSSAPWASTNRITRNPVKGSASKNGKSFDIC